MSKRVLAVGDQHSGHMAGLTPPMYWLPERDDDPRLKRSKFARLEREMWGKYIKKLDAICPVDICLYMGDGVEGKGFRSGGTELITSDREEQAQMCAETFNEIIKRCPRPPVIIGVYGTAYHTSSDGEDWENLLAEKVNFNKLGAHEWVDVNGCVFDIKHQLSSSVIPHGRHTSTARELLWNQLWSDLELVPRARVLLRGHVHYHQFCGTVHRMGMSCPALQAMGTKFGARMCSGIVDWGMLHFDISDDGEIEGWTAHISDLKAQHAVAIKV